MAAITLPAPGAEGGPCEMRPSRHGVVLSCGHPECSESRRMADQICVVCGIRIGYGAPFYAVGPDDRPRWEQLAHQSCWLRRLGGLVDVAKATNDAALGAVAGLDALAALGPLDDTEEATP